MATAPIKTTATAEGEVVGAHWEALGLHSGGRVDRENAIVHGVKVCGLHSQNQIGGKPTRYTPEALKGAVGMYEGVQIFANHPPPETIRVGTRPVRDFDDALGQIRSPRYVDGVGIVGDAYFVKSHPNTPRALDEATEARAGYGFSHNFDGRRRDNGDHVAWTKIGAVYSVDLVTRPATTGGFFESHSEDESVSWQDSIASIDAKLILNARPDLVSAAMQEGGQELRSQLESAQEEAKKANEKAAGLEQQLAESRKASVRSQADALFGRYGKKPEEVPEMGRNAVYASFEAATDEASVKKAVAEAETLMSQFGFKKLNGAAATTTAGKPTPAVGSFEGAMSEAHNPTPQQQGGDERPKFYRDFVPAK